MNLTTVLSPTFKPYKHQTFSADFYLDLLKKGLGALNTSDCGTGKTGGVIMYLAKLKDAGELPPVLVLGPLSILQPAWGNDINSFAAGLTYSICYAKNRRKAMEAEADIHITNHDAIKFLTQKENIDLLKKFANGIIIVDEFTAFKNPTAQRTKAMMFVVSKMRQSILLSGTPRPKSVLDMFVPAMLCDRGVRLGNRYYAFRARMCIANQVGRDPNAVQWEERPEANSTVTEKLRDITIRFAASDCLDLPPNQKRYMEVELPAKTMKAYKEMLKESQTVGEDGAVNAINAAVRTQKLLQMCTGAVYNEEGQVVNFHKERYQLVFDLAREVEHSVIAFNWRHERNAIAEVIDAYNKRAPKGEKINYAFIDGTVRDPEVRSRIVEEYQAGRINIIICHPASAGHGLTLTRGTRTIWCSATNNAEHFIQLNHRIDRAGQKQKTETIMISAKGTGEPRVYKKLVEGKVKTQADMLRAFNESTRDSLEKY